MKIQAKQFELFHGKQILFAKMKEELSEEEIAEIKESYKEAWGYWKNLMAEALHESGEEFEMDTENWTNGWGVKKYFWTRTKHAKRKNDASNISVSINENSMRVHLEWHNHHSDRSGNSIDDHNAWMDYVEDWMENQSIDPGEYKVWTSLESDDEAYITLETYLRDEEVQKQFSEMIQSEENIWVRIGKVFAKEEVLEWEHAEEAIAEVIRELEEIYEITGNDRTSNQKYWLFNVFYSKNPVVWEKSKELGVAAMQYEGGRQSKSAVTRNLKRIKEIAVGDYIIAYTGNKGFLALGQVTRPFYQENDESKFIYADAVKDEGWRQRVDVDWFKVLEGPVKSSGSGLKKRLGLDPTTVMSSETIFEIPEEGYRFVEGLMEGKAVERDFLAAPLSSIFNSREEANMAFSLVQETLEKLGVKNPGDPRVSITITRNRIHVNYCNWLVLGFSKSPSNTLKLKLALIEEGIENSYEKEHFTAKEAEEPVYLVSDIPWEDYQTGTKLQAAYDDTLILINERFKNWSKTPYKNHHNKQLEQAVFNELFRQEVFSKGLTDDSSDHGDEIAEEVEIPQVTFEGNKPPTHLYFEGMGELLKQVQTAMVNGKHIILTGPPGTGKSKLAKFICDMFEADFKMSTATSDWSTYETIGGYRPNSDGTLSFNPGLFLECFKDEETNLPQNKWLIIDEMNRADIDKAFGSLFSALTGDPITLNFQTKSGEPLLLRPQQGEKTVVPNEWEYIIPESWRLIGTMNTLDKASLYEMSYAFMRRFAFIPVGIPRDIDEKLVGRLLSTWKINDFRYTKTLVSTWKEINKYRQIGPAIIEDIARYVKDEGDLTSAIILYVLPQFEGLMDKDILEFIQKISQLPQVEGDKLTQFAEDFFHIKG
ncbi:HI_0552 family protein [Salimicrobium sp. PL1-032A]|uniref:HI_0552 family protein n=1 Tax=Salimicrobium sp. PL1-032A TaxID=3095364 RepID=UPI0032608DC3